jgi:hypothetical protein
MTRTAVLVLALASLLGPSPAALAHDFQPGYWELREVGPDVYSVLWRPPAFGEFELAVEPIYPPECAAAEPTAADAGDPPRATLRCVGGLGGKVLEVGGFEQTPIDVLLRVDHRDGSSETHLLSPVRPAVTLARPTSALHRAATYLRLGVEHILLGVDHQLFVLGLLLIVGDRWMLVKTVTSFTFAHSITLAIASLGYASAPMRPLDAAIALSILFLGPEIVRVWRGETSLTIRHPWVVAFAFGLLHGFGFASGLTSMGLPADEIPLALLLFNVGVEIGQLLFVFLVLGLARSFRVLEMRWPRWVEALPGYTVGTLGAYWTIQRTVILLGGLR